MRHKLFKKNLSVIILCGGIGKRLQLLIKILKKNLIKIKKNFKKNIKNKLIRKIIKGKKNINLNGRIEW